MQHLYHLALFFHMPRQYNLSLARLHDVYYDGDVALEDCEMVECKTNDMKADVLTKSFKTQREWQEKLLQLKIFSSLQDAIVQIGISSASAQHP